MAEEYYKEISIDGITPELFPNVAVYLKTGGTNYMLYKPHGSQMTADDLERLQRRSEFIYVRTGDMEEVSAYQEENLANLLGRKDLKSLSRGKILFQICADYTGEVIESPPKVKEVGRCRNLVQQINWFVSHDKEAMAALKAVAAVNPYNIVHGVQVATLTLLMHSRIFPKIIGAPLEDVGIGAMLLDMGMALGDSDPGGSAGSLSHHEYQMMKLHATMGYDFLNRMGGFSNATLSVVHYHHERYDGKGYPDHLNGEAIPKGVQLAALCDSFTALTSERGYRKAVTTEQALQTMKGSTGAHEPILFQSFEKIVREVKY